MRADDLRIAVVRIVEILEKSGIRAVVDQFRKTRGGDRTAASAKLGHAGAAIMEGMEGLAPAERQVVRLLYLDSLASPAYWDELLHGSSEAGGAQAGEIVRLASRVMFATNHLPALLQLMGDIDDQPPTRHPVPEGAARLVTRLADAGEKSSDPDRVARSIDGIDMLYSACASIARKPVMDLRLECVDGSETRDIHFTGERDAIAAVVAVIESIPGALVGIDSDADIDLDEIVASLPIFADLRTLAAVGSFSESDLNDIAETIHQGALLTLESGVVVFEETEAAAGDGQARARQQKPPARTSRQATSTAATVAPIDDGATGDAAVNDAATDSAGLNDVATGGVGPTAAAQTSPPASPSPAGDRHYEEYLRERDAMQRPAAPASATSPADHGDDMANTPLKDPLAEDRMRADAVEELLRSLSRSRDER